MIDRIERFRNIRPIFKPLLIIGGVILAAGLALLFGFFVMLLWNWLMPEIFGLKEITYWQAWGLVLLAHILFKAGKWHDHNHKPNHSDHVWKRRFKEKLKGAFEEESENNKEPEGGEEQEDNGKV